jgi:hypothetical protein
VGSASAREKSRGKPDLHRALDPGQRLAVDDASLGEPPQNASLEAGCQVQKEFNRSGTWERA